MPFNLSWITSPEMFRKRSPSRSPFLRRLDRCHKNPTVTLPSNVPVDKRRCFAMQLFLLRHAEAESNAATDEVRTLTGRGTKQAEAIGKFCLEHDFVPEMILSSPLTRAEETARIVARELNLPKL